MPSVLEPGPETLTDRSALGLLLTIEPVTVALLLPGVGSGLLAETDAVSLNGAPLPRLDGAATTRVKVSEAPEAMVPVAVSVAVPPDWLRLKPSVPPVCVIDPKLEPAGSVSVRTTP